MSIKPPSNRAAADAIRSVMMEEMLHMALVGNLMCSLGGRARVGKENAPSFPLRMTFTERDFSDRRFNIDLSGFTPEQLAIFLQIELPADLHEAFGRMAEGLEVPAPTIGDFYDNLVKDLKAMAAAAPREKVFVGAGIPQIGPGYYWGSAGQPIVVKSLEHALEAITLIVRQGEGATTVWAAGEAHYFADPRNLGHYFRFKELAKGKRYKADDSPLGDPSGEALSMDFVACVKLKSESQVV